jgi:hypothetical protein
MLNRWNMTLSISPACGGILHALYSQAPPGHTKRQSGTAGDPAANGAFIWDWLTVSNCGVSTYSVPGRS